MRRARRLVLFFLAACLLSSCDWTGLAYDHLDFLMRHYVAGFVDLRPEQQQAFDRTIDELMAWHRTAELPRYVEEARKSAITSQAPKTAAQIDEQVLELDRFGEILFQRVLGDIAPLLTQLDDAQVQQILAEVDKRIEKLARRDAKLDDTHWREHERDETRDQLEKYVGALTPIQEQKLHDWSLTLIRDPALDHRAALAWRTQMADVLRQRNDPGNIERVKALGDVKAPAIDAFEHKRAAMRARYLVLLADLSNTYTAEQHKHLQATFNDLAAELEKLATEPPSKQQALLAPPTENQSAPS